MKSIPLPAEQLPLLISILLSRIRSDGSTKRIDKLVRIAIEIFIIKFCESTISFDRKAGEALQSRCLHQSVRLCDMGAGGLDAEAHCEGMSIEPQRGCDVDERFGLAHAPPVNIVRLLDSREHGRTGFGLDPFGRQHSRNGRQRPV